MEKQFIENQKGEAIIALINIIVHDFGDILSIIRGYTELSINTLSDNTKARKNLEKVILAADRGKDMIEHYFLPTMSPLSHKFMSLHLIIAGFTVLKIKYRTGLWNWPVP